MCGKKIGLRTFLGAPSASSSSSSDSTSSAKPRTPSPSYSPSSIISASSLSSTAFFFFLKCGFLLVGIAVRRVSPSARGGHVPAHDGARLPAPPNHAKPVRTTRTPPLRPCHNHRLCTSPIYTSPTQDPSTLLHPFTTRPAPHPRASRHTLRPPWSSGAP